MSTSKTEKPFGKVTVPCNPASPEAVNVEPLSVPSESFFMNGTTAATNSYALRFCVRRLSSVNVRQTRGRDSSSDLGMISMLFVELFILIILMHLPNVVEEYFFVLFVCGVRLETLT